MVSRSVNNNVAATSVAETNAPSRRLVGLSKKLSFILRHGAEKIKLPIRDDGFVLVTDLLAHKEMKVYNTNVDEIGYIVETCNKKRFKLSGSGSELCIRASQGHSIKGIESEKLLHQLTLEEVNSSEEYAVIIHGTRREFVNSIMTGAPVDQARGAPAAAIAAGVPPRTDAHVPAPGLSRCKRNHVHLSLGFPMGFDASRWTSVWEKYAPIAEQMAAVPEPSPLESAASASAPVPMSVFHILCADSASVQTSSSSSGRSNTSSSSSTTSDNANTSTLPVAISGIRYSTDAILFIDIRRAMADGIKFYRSANNVILTAGAGATGVLPARYIVDIIELQR